MSGLKVPGNVLHQALLLRFSEDFGPEGVDLGKVVVVGRVVLGHVARDGPLVVQSRRSVGWTREAVGEVVGVAGVVRVERHRSVSLVIERLGPVRAVDGKVEVIGAQTVAVGVRVGEKAALEHLVGARLDAGHHVRRAEGDLLHLGKVVLGIAIQDHPADGDERKLGLRPNLGQVEGIPAEFLGLFKGHHLDLERPRRELALGDRVVQIADRVIGIAGGKFVRFVHAQIADALVALIFK